MMYRILAAAALTLSLAGAAMAQSDSGTGGNAGAGSDSGTAAPAGNTDNGTTASGAMGSGDNVAMKKMFGGFYTDDTMTTLRSDEEIGTMYKGMSAEEQAAIQKQCTVDHGGANAVCAKLPKS